MPDQRRTHRVLVVAYYFPPLGLSGVQRTLKFVRYLPQFGWQPTVLTVEDRGYFAKDEALLREIDGLDIDVIRTPSIDPLHLFRRRSVVRMPSGQTLGRLSKLSQALFIPDNKIGWKKHAVAAAMEYLAEHPVDVIYATAPPYTDFLIGMELKRRTGLPLVLDYRDAWVENPLHSYLTPLHRAQHSRLERKTLRAADAVVSINRPIKERILKGNSFLSHGEVQIISQGYDQADFETVRPDRAQDGVLRFLYAGTFYYNRTPEYFLRALQKVFTQKPELRGSIEAHFVGTTREEDTRLIEVLQLSDAVRQHGYLPHNETVQQLIDADVLWMTIGRGKGEDMMSTGKLYEYLGARKPVLACIPDGDARQVLSKSGAAFIVAPDDIDAIADQILTLYDLHKNDRLPAPSYSYVEQFSRRTLAGQLATLLASLLEADPDGAGVRTRSAGTRVQQNNDTHTSHDET
ncbi:MAG: glycosyl transferase family 1 [Ignavibacteria bacterium]|nr:MAG: glycosyl transferase family 1 [Ignavibacteria bacterium]